MMLLRRLRVAVGVVPSLDLIVTYVSRKLELEGVAMKYLVV